MKKDLSEIFLCLCLGGALGCGCFLAVRLEAEKREKRLIVEELTALRVLAEWDRIEEEEGR